MKELKKRIYYYFRRGKMFLKKIERFLLRSKKVFKEKGTYYGIYYVTSSIIKIIFGWLKISFLYYYKIFNLPKNFIFEGKNYNYFYHQYNTTWRNERTIEIPIIWDIVKKYHGKEILEVGNVLSHYFNVDYDILDKHEKAKGVINKDVANFQSPKKYDLIVSISTLEHVGWDMGENLKNPMKILQAIKNLKKCLAPKGKIIITLPLGYNFSLDELLEQGKIQFTKQYYLKRISRNNNWIQVDWDECCNEKYDFIHHSAKALLIGVYCNSREVVKR